LGETIVPSDGTRTIELPGAATYTHASLDFPKRAPNPKANVAKVHPGVLPPVAREGRNIRSSGVQTPHHALPTEAGVR